MVEAVVYAARSSAGTVQGSVGGDGGSSFLMVGSGEEVSLNLSPSSVAGYERSGQDLLIQLIDGRTITISGFFVDPGMAENRLYLSSDGQVIAVSLSSDATGMLVPVYGAPDVWDKYSDLDALRFAEGDRVADAAMVTDEPAGMAPFAPGILAGLGGAGAAGAAIIGGGAIIGGIAGGGGGGGGNEGGGGHTPPAVDDPVRRVTLTTNTPSLEFPVSGTGHPGDTVTVDLGGNTQTTTIGENGRWEVVFPEASLPGDGTHGTVVVVTRPDGGAPVTLDGPTAIIDMTPPALSLTEGSASSGHVENADDHANGVRIGGTSEAGAAITVQLDGAQAQTVAAADGTWHVVFPPADVAGGERTGTLTVTATDALGNSSTLTDGVAIDTVPHPLTIDPVTADGIVNAAEAGAALTVTGATAPGATVTVGLGGATRSVTAGADGRWSAEFAAGTLEGGTYGATVTASTQDSAGNRSNATRSVAVDTTSTVSITGPVAGDDVVNATEAAAGVSLAGQGEPGAAISVDWAGGTRSTTVGADGSWSVTFPAESVTPGEYASTATVTATDAVGNTATATREIRVDTTTSVSVNAGQAGGDDIVSGADRNGGVTLTGRGEPGANVSVVWSGVTRSGTVGADGTWSVSYGAADIPAGTYAATASVTTTDRAGNTATASHAMQVDTEVTGFRRATLSTGDDNVLNAAESAQGLTVTGIVEPGSTVMVRLGSGMARAASVAADGSWSLTIPPGDIPAGEATVSLTAVATDRVGNSATLTENVAVDQVVRSFARTGGPIGGDGTLNAAEVAAGLPVGGTAEPGASITVSLSNGATRTTQADASGNWTVTFASADLPRGELNATATVTATDRAGNTSTLTEAFRVDTVSPGSPEVVSFSRDGDGLRGIGTEATDDIYAFARVDANGGAQPMNAFRSDDPVFGETNFRFSTPVPDGSYLVINTADGAGNNSSTLLIVDNTNAAQVSLSRPGLAGFDLSAIDLSFAPQAQMTIDSQTLQELTGPGQTLMVKGGADDSVTLTGATATGESRVIDGDRYTIFTLGDTGGTVLIDDQIRTTF